MGLERTGAWNGYALYPPKHTTPNSVVLARGQREGTLSVKASPRTVRTGKAEGKEHPQVGPQVSSEGARLLVFLGGARVQP